MLARRGLGGCDNARVHAMYVAVLHAEFVLLLVLDPVSFCS